jgi:hypothetical protein
MQHTITLVVGDWSFDGHNRTHNFAIKSNLDVDAVSAAFEMGEEKLGVKFQETVAAEFEDNVLPRDVIEKLENHGFVLADVVGDCEDEEQVTIDSDVYVDIWLFIAKLGNPDFRYELTSHPSINVGGYGLFT